MVKYRTNELDLNVGFWYTISIITNPTIRWDIGKKK